MREVTCKFCEAPLCWALIPLFLGNGALVNDLCVAYSIFMLGNKITPGKPPHCYIYLINPLSQNSICCLVT